MWRYPARVLYIHEMAAECLAKTTSIDNEQTRVFMPPQMLTRTHAPVGLGANLVTTGRSGGVPFVIF